MKNIVISDEFKTKDFKPQGLLNEYFQLTQKEIGALWGQKQATSTCPACLGQTIEKAFVKYTSSYMYCRNCHSLFSHLRPKDQDIVNFYKHSAARKFWNERLYKDTANQRQTKIIKPRLQWIEDSTQEYFPGAKSYCDINANQPGYFQEVQELSLFKTKTFLNPLVPLQGSAIGGVELVHSPWWQNTRSWDVVSLFEVLDHTSGVDDLLDKVHASLSQGGLCFLTSILASGFDIQTLWDRADHIHPVDRLNMFSIEGLKKLFQRHGFEALEVSTPGVLDVQIVAKAYEADPQLPLPRFIKYLIGRGEQEQKDFQEFLQANLLSSYARILIRKQS